MQVNLASQQVCKVVYVLPLRRLRDPTQLVVIETLHCKPVQSRLRTTKKHKKTSSWLHHANQLPWLSSIPLADLGVVHEGSYDAAGAALPSLAVHHGNMQGVRVQPGLDGLAHTVREEVWSSSLCTNNSSLEGATELKFASFCSS